MSDKMKKDLKAVLKLRVDLIVKAIESFSLSGYDTYVTCYTDGVVDLPSHLYKDRLLTLNVSVNAVGKFEVLEDYLHIQVSFSNKVHDVFIPFLGILTVSAVENERPVISLDPISGFATSAELMQRCNDHCESKWVSMKYKNISPETNTPEHTQPSKPVPHLRRVK